MACQCQSLSVYVQSIKVETATTYGTGIGDVIGGLVQKITIESDDVSFVSISTGVRLTFPTGGVPGAPYATMGQRAWPENDGSVSVEQGKTAFTGRKRIATVVPFDPSGCQVQLDCVVRFFEKDWDDLQDLLEQAAQLAVQQGIIAAPPAAGPFTALARGAYKIIRKGLNAITGFRSEMMGEFVIRLPQHSLDDPGNLDQFPWGAELLRDKMTEKKRDSFVYTDTFERYGGKWVVELYFERECQWPTGSSGGSSGGSGSSSGGSAGSSAGSSGGSGSSSGGSAGSSAGSPTSSDGSPSESHAPIDADVEDPPAESAAVGVAGNPVQRALRMLEATPPHRRR